MRAGEAVVEDAEGAGFAEVKGFVAEHDEG